MTHTLLEKNLWQYPKPKEQMHLKKQIQRERQLNGYVKLYMLSFLISTLIYNISKLEFRNILNYYSTIFNSGKTKTLFGLIFKITLFSSSRLNG